MSSCYILYSSRLNRYYIGVTTEKIQLRIEKHNSGLYGSHRYTAKANDWELYLVIEAENYGHAVRMERKIKSQKSRHYYQNLKQYKELQDRLIDECKKF